MIKIYHQTIRLVIISSWDKLHNILNITLGATDNLQVKILLISDKLIDYGITW